VLIFITVIASRLIQVLASIIGNQAKGLQKLPPNPAHFTQVGLFLLYIQSKKRLASLSHLPINITLCVCVCVFRVMDVNVKAALFVGQCVVKDMLAREEGGSIVNVSSQASQRALPLHTVYCKLSPTSPASCTLSQLPHYKSLHFKLYC